MFHHPEDAARFECVEERPEHGLVVAGFRPVVHVAEGEHEIHGFLRRDVDVLRRVDAGDDDLIVDGRVLGEPAQEARAGLAVVVVGGLVDVGWRRVEAPLVAQDGREDFGVPAAARRDLDDVQMGLESEEKQRLARVAPYVARAARVRTVSGGERLVDRVLRGRRCQRGLAGEEKDRGGEIRERFFHELMSPYAL